MRENNSVIGNACLNSSLSSPTGLHAFGTCGVNPAHHLIEALLRKVANQLLSPFTRYLHSISGRLLANQFCKMMRELAGGEHFSDAGQNDSGCLRLAHRA